MRPVRMWAGLIFLTLGILGILAMTGTLDWDKTVGEWWPVAIIGWALAGMFTERTFDLDWSILAVFGIALLADQQGWAVEGLIWTMMFLFIGAAILIAPTLRKRHHAKGHHQDVSLATPATRV